MKWAIDPNHSAVTFTIRHMMSKVRGQLKLKEGWIEAENDHSIATVDVTIDTASIDTGVEARDAHLRSADGHFDVENYPVATFKSMRIEGKDPKHFKIVGDLALHGITKEVTLDAEFGGEGKDPWGNRRVSFSATTKLNRKDFNLTWNQALEAGGFILGDDVKVEIEIEAIPAQGSAEAKEKIAAEAAAESR